MKTLFSFASFFLSSAVLFAQTSSYYEGIDFTNSGHALKEDLHKLISDTHSNPISYKTVWEVLKKSDKDPDNAQNVLLLYGYEEGSDSDVKNDRSREKTSNGGSVGDWNREHVYPRSLGKPNLGSNGPGSDAHMLRPTDVQFNGKRGNLPFEDATGNAKRVSNSWYPGDEWKGDVARIIMYMFLRYGNRCEPNRVAKSANTYHEDMPDVFLRWNMEDPVSELERNRNNEVFRVQKNRNPFIDDPTLAKKIWGGPFANKAGPKSAKNNGKTRSAFSVYPNPTSDFIEIKTGLTIQEICIYDSNGELIQRYIGAEKKIYLPKPKGVYWIEINALEGSERIEVIKNE